MLEEILPAAIAAGLVAIFVTVLIERFGGVVGGALGTVPTTIVPAVAGMAAAQGEQELMDSLSVVPAGMLINAIFLSVWIYLPRATASLGSERSLAVTTATALLAWAMFGMVTILCIGELSEYGTGPRKIGMIGIALTAVVGIVLGWKPDESPKGSRKVSKPILLARGLMAATAIGASVWVAGLGYPLLAGLASVFPAIFLTSMVSLWISQGPSVPRGAAAPMLLGGGSVGVYSLVAMYSLEAHGIILGSIMSWVTAVAVWSMPSYIYLRWRTGVGDSRKVGS
ncbi:MAG: hypothetical protein VX461_03100 [Candidatus Thermoplasmatota archaeon]|nr:hypothetical protein [Candidatus Thermoplasmatota archaeon]